MQEGRTRDAEINSFEERGERQIPADGNHKVPVQPIQIDFENMEESLRNMLRHNGQPSGNEKHDTTRQMQVYKKVITKIRNHANLVERENNSLKRQISAITSGTPHGQRCAEGEHADASKAVVNGEDSGELEDIRTTCLMLSKRIKRMEEQNTQLLMNSEKQRLEYERCLDRVARQVIQALACQQRLQLTCDSLRMQVHCLTGNAGFAYGQSPHSASSAASADSPNGPHSAGSCYSDDAFGANTPATPVSGYASWPQRTQNTADAGYQNMYASPTWPTHPAESEGHQNAFLYNQRLTMLERLAQNTPNACFNGFPPHMLNFEGFDVPQIEHQYEGQAQCHPNNRMQPNRAQPLLAIPETVEPAPRLQVQNGHCQEEVWREAPVRKAQFPRRAVDDGFIERGRERRGVPRDRNKVGRSRSFDNHASFERRNVERPRDYPKSPEYRPGPPYSSVPNGARLNSEPPAYRRPENMQVPAKGEKNSPIDGRIPNMQSPPPQHSIPQNQGQNSGSPIITRSHTGAHPAPEHKFHNDTQVMPSSAPAGREFVRQSRDMLPGYQRGNAHKRSNSQDSRQNAENQPNSAPPFARNECQRSFRVSRSHERPRPGRANDDVWLPRSGMTSQEQAAAHQAAAERRKFIRRKAESSPSDSDDLPPPPPPPPEEDIPDQEVSAHIVMLADNTTNNTHSAATKEHETQAQTPPEVARVHRPSKNKREDPKKQALKRDSYTAACRKSQSLDHLYQIETINDEGGNSQAKTNITEPVETLPITDTVLFGQGYGTFDLHSVTNRGAKDTEGARETKVEGVKKGGGMASEIRCKDATLVSDSARDESPPTTYMDMGSPDSENGSKPTKPQPASQPLPTKSRARDVDNDRKQNEGTDASIPSAKYLGDSLDRAESERSPRDVIAQPGLSAASSCEALSSSSTPQTRYQRRMSEGMARVANSRSKIAAPSHKRIYAGRNQPRGLKQGSPDTARVTPGRKLAPVSGSGRGDGNCTLIQTSISHTDVSSKTRSPPAQRRVGIEASGSHPNLSKSVPESPQVARKPEGSQANIVYQTSLTGSIPRGSQLEPDQRTESHRTDAVKPNFNGRSYSSETRSNLPNVKDAKGRRRSLSGYRSSKRAEANLPKKQPPEQKVEKKNDGAQRENGGKKKGGQTFVDMMKSKFGGKNAGSQSKKSSESEKPRRSDPSPGSPTPQRSVIDPRTYTLEQNTIPPPGFSGKKGAKKKGKAANPAESIGRKLSQPFVNVPPQLGDSIAEKDSGGKKSFLKRQNSKRSRGDRLATLIKGDQFSRVELIPVDSLASLDIGGNHVFLNGQISHVYPQVNGDFEATDCDREVEAMTSRNLSARPHEYENVILVPQPIFQKGAGRTDPECGRNLGPAPASNMTSTATAEGSRFRNQGSRDNSLQRGQADNPMYSDATGGRIWGSYSSQSVNKLVENSQSTTSLHNVKGTGKEFVSSACDVTSPHNHHDAKEQRSPQHDSTKFKLIELKDLAEEHSCDVTTPDFCSSHTESGMSSTVFSTTDSSKSGKSNSSFDSWPKKGVELSPRLRDGEGESPDSCYANGKPFCDEKLHSPRKVKSRPSLGSFGYGSGVSKNSTPSSSKGSLHRSQSPKPGDGARDNANRCQDSSSEGDQTPAQSPKTHYVPRRYAERKSVSPSRPAQGSRLQKMPRPTRLNGAVPGRVRMGVSSIAAESYRSTELTSQPEKETRKLASLNPVPNAHRLKPPSPSKPVLTEHKDVRRPGLACSTSANLPVPTRVPQGRGIPVPYSQRQQQQAR